METTALFQPVELNAVIAAVWDDFELVAEEKEAALIMATLPTINALGLQMNQLFYNLFSNALNLPIQKSSR
jgi:signal transduction histidine kinase